MNSKVPSTPLTKADPKLTRAQRQALRQSQRFKVIRDLQRDAKAGDKKVWARLSDSTQKHHQYWKTLIRDRVKRGQEPRCCYCKRWLLNNAYASPIEHVLPSSKYPSHALRLRNLALACHDCNYLKADDDWSEALGSHPSSKELGFFHPSYHAYDSHIQYVHYETNELEYISFHGLTTQGRHLCTNLLSAVVGKKRLEESFPGLQLWTQATGSLDSGSQSAPDRPELHVFGRMLSQAVADQLDDGAKISALWVCGNSGTP